jgi:hypothetical protein
LCRFFFVCLLHSCQHEYVSWSYYLHEFCMVRTSSWPWDVWRRDNNMFLAGDRSCSFSRWTNLWFWVEIVCCFFFCRGMQLKDDFMSYDWKRSEFFLCLLATYLPQVVLRKNTWGWR